MSKIHERARAEAEAQERTNSATVEVLIASTHEELTDAFDRFVKLEANALGLRLNMLPTPVLVAFAEIQRGMLADAACAFLDTHTHAGPGCVVPSWLRRELDEAVDRAIPLLTDYIPETQKWVRVHRRAASIIHNALNEARR